MPTKARSTTGKKAAAKVPTESMERGCDACPLKDTWGRISSPRMKMKGNPEGDILVVGEGPGEEEDLGDDVFIGKTGQFLRKVIPYKFMDRVAFTNSVRCRPPGNRTPTGLEKHCCSIHLESDVDANPEFKAALLVGAAPQTLHVPKASITQIHGVRFPIKVGDQVMWGFPVFHPSFVMRTGGENSTQYPCYQADIRKFFREVDKWRPATMETVAPTDVIVSTDEAEVRAIIDRMEGTLGFDVETSKLKPWMHDASIITASFSDGKLTVAFPVEHPADPQPWALRLILEIVTKRRWCAHQSSFEYIWLLYAANKLGVDFWFPEQGFDDSMALGRLHHNRDQLLGLDILSRIILGIDVKSLSPVDARNIMAYSLDEILPYNGLDAWGSARIVRHLGGRVHEYNYEHALRASASAAWMEWFGIPVDQERARELKTKWHAIAQEKMAEARDIYEVKAFERERQKEFNIGSATDVGIALVEYGRLHLPLTAGSQKEGAAKQNYSTDDEVLGPLAETNPLAKCTLEYREATKHESTYIDPVLNIDRHSKTGMLHAAYSSYKTHTWRRSAEDPNIQNWPKRRHREIRGMVRAPPGHIIMACDSGQIQARVFGMASSDQALIDSFINHVDIHNHWLGRALEYYPPYLDRLAEQTNMAGQPEDKIRKKGRDVIKYDFVFASFFGQTAQSCSEKTGIPLRIVQDLLDAEFWGGYPDAFKWLKARRKEYRETGGVYTLTGRWRYGVMTGNEPIITAIQGGEAELVIAAECDLSELSIREKDPYIQPRWMIHDDISLIIPDSDDKIEEYMSIVTEAMNKVRFKWQTVPLTTEVLVGYRWDDLHEIAVVEGAYNR